MKKLVIVLSLLVILVCALSCTAICYAEEVEASEDVIVEETTQEAEIDTSSNEAITWLKNTWEKSKGFVIGAFSGLSISLIVSAVVSAFSNMFAQTGGDVVSPNINTTYYINNNIEIV